MTKEEAVFLYSEAVRLDLSGKELLRDPELVMRDCNGIGADWMGKWLRGLVSKLNPSLNPVAAVHDRRYVINGSTDDRKYADEEFRANGFKAAKQYAWFRLRRYAVIRNTNRFYAALRMGGFAAWEAAKK